MVEGTEAPPRGVWENGDPATLPSFLRSGSLSRERQQSSSDADDDVHLALLGPADMQRSHNGLPYPKLPVLIQSFLEAHDRVSLCDVVDGSDVSDEWGSDHLALDGHADVAWARRKNEAIPVSTRSCFGGGVPTKAVQKRELWQWAVSTKSCRLGWSTPPSRSATHFRLLDSPDPWHEPRECS
ncbi:hypothetical protein NKR19_g10045 [Coniochaeta hoffmannii]|uniref:Uncharacterized protein n=1 Tax=Coniochaeta hoffmannii TaxID=91930 RepID=A0AA38R1H9_9PEZI|nr:hypothetical protein NKR19_g10045 [Coniochaeta hoffmannii]